MKKMLLTGAMALMGLMVSAQGFMVTADIDTDDLGNFDGITETLGFGYFVNDAFVVGAKMAGDEDFNVFARYYWNESLFLSATAPTEDLTDNLTVGAGYSFNAWNSLYVEPSYSMPLKEDAAGDREGSFNLGVAFRF
jgi:hypothetical protein